MADLITDNIEMHKACAKCGLLFPVSYFGVLYNNQKSGSTYYRAYCKTCRLDKQREYIYGDDFSVADIKPRGRPVRPIDEAVLSSIHERNTNGEKITELYKETGLSYPAFLKQYRAYKSRQTPVPASS